MGVNAGYPRRNTWTQLERTVAFYTALVRVFETLEVFTYDEVDEVGDVVKGESVSVDMIRII